MDDNEAPVAADELGDGAAASENGSSDRDESVVPVETGPVERPTLDEMVALIAAAASENGSSSSGSSSEATAESASEPDEPAALPEDAFSADVEAAPKAEDASAPEQAPETVEASQPVRPSDRMWTRVPAWTVFGLFLVLTGVTVYLLWPSATGAFTVTPLYRLLVFGGAGLVLVGLMTALAVWLSARSRAGEDGRAGLGRTIWLRSLAWTAAGVLVWWAGLLLLDLHHAGVI